MKEKDFKEKKDNTETVSKKPLKEEENRWEDEGGSPLTKESIQKHIDKKSSHNTDK